MVAIKLSGGTKMNAALDRIASRLKTAAAVDIGFMGGATYPDGTSVPLIAALNEFGVPSHEQPPRPYFRRMIHDHKGEWPRDIGAALKAHDYDAAQALAVVGERVDNQLQQSIRDLWSPPLAPSTIKRKGFTKPLIETALMLNSSTHRVRTGDES